MKPVNLLPTLLLAGCIAIPTQPQAWQTFTDKVDAMNPGTLQKAQADALDPPDNSMDDFQRLQRSYVLSRGNPTSKDLEQAENLLAAVDKNGPYTHARNQISREIDLLKRLYDARQDITALQENLERTEQAAEEYRQQLKALRSIDNDIAVGRSGMEAPKP